MTQPAEQNTDQPDDEPTNEPAELPEPVGLHVYWLRTTNREALVQFLALIEALRDCFDLIDSTYPNKPRTILHEQISGAFREGLWDAQACDVLYDALDRRRDIMSNGLKSVDADALGQHTLALASLLHKLQWHRTWALAQER